MFDKLPLGMSYSAGDCEFNVNQRYMLNQLSLNRNTLEIRLYTDQLMKMCDQRLAGT